MLYGLSVSQKLSASGRQSCIRKHRPQFITTYTIGLASDVGLTLNAGDPDTFQ